MQTKINKNKILTEILYNKLETLDVPKNEYSYEFTHDEYIFLVNFVDELLTETFKIKPETIINNLDKNYIKNIINKIK
tara:strand:- start:605 stop:838 length:234 start_codon:yes stop_codon:yes gene_type:complete